MHPNQNVPRLWFFIISLLSFGHLALQEDDRKYIMYF